MNRPDVILSSSAATGLADSNKKAATVDFSDCVQRILDRIKGSNSNDYDWSGDEGSSTLHHIEQQNAQRLLESELSELSYLCTEALYEQQKQQRLEQHQHQQQQQQQCMQATPVTSSNVVLTCCDKNLQEKDDKSFFQLINIEIDSLSTIVEILDAHVRTALSVKNLVENALKVLTNSSTSTNNRGYSNSEFHKWIHPEGTGGRMLKQIHIGLEAASILLFLACSQVTSTVPERYGDAEDNNDNNDEKVEIPLSYGAPQSTFVNEDAIENSIALFRVHLMKNLLPAFNQTGHLMVQNTKKTEDLSKINGRKRKRMVSAPKKRRKSSITTKEIEEENEDGYAISSDVDDEGEDQNTTIKVPQDVKPNPAILREMKKFYSFLQDSTIQFHLIVMERLQMLVERVPLDDQQILLLASGAMSSFEIDCYIANSISNVTTATLPTKANFRSKHTSAGFAQEVQISSIGLITSIFRKYVNHRDVILEDLFPMMLKIPSYKRSLRMFPVEFSRAPLLQDSLHQSNSMIQMMTALILSLVHSCVIRPTCEYETIISEQICDDEEIDEDGTDDNNDNNNNNNNNNEAHRHKSIETRRPKTKGNIKTKTQKKRKDNYDDTAKVVSGLNDSWKVASSLIQHLLNRCSVGKGDTASEFRPFLSIFVEDLILVFVMPEYPAAETLLLAIQRRLNSDILQAAHPVNPSNAGKVHQKTNQILETTYINMAFDLIAKINSFLARVIALQRNKPISIKIPCTHPATQNPSDKIIFSDYCDQKNGSLIKQFMLSCDSCQLFYPGILVGIPDAESVPNEWMCDFCRLGHLALNERRKYGTVLIDDPYIIHQAFIAFTICKLGSHGMKDQIRYHLAIWIDEIVQKYHQLQKEEKHERNELQLEEFPIAQLTHHSMIKRIVSDLLDLWENAAFDSSLGSCPVGDLLSDEGNKRVVLAKVVHTSALSRSFRSEISFLIRIMSDEPTGEGSSYGSSNQSIRKMALKTIERIVEGDPELMLSSIITKAVSYRLTDESISVREAAVSLVGAYVVYSPAVAKAFHSSLLMCLNDVGVSVRKRCIRIFQAILTLSMSNNQGYDGIAVVCDTMLRMAADPKEEDGVRDLIHELFFHLWLENGTDPVTIESTTSLKAPITPNPPISGDAESFHSVNNIQVGPFSVTPNEDDNDGTEFTTDFKKQPSAGNQLSCHRVDLAAAQMMQVVRIAGTGDHLRTLLLDLLVDEVPSSTNDDKDTTESNNPSTSTKRGTSRQAASITSSAATISASRKRARIRIVGRKQQEKYSQLLVDALTELLLSLEERRSRTNDGDSFSRVGADIVATLRTLDVFAMVCPVSILKHIDTLLPYLKADNGVSVEDESSIVGAVCDILYRLASSSSKVMNADNNTFLTVLDRLSRNGDVAKDIVQITYRFGTSTLNSAVRTITILATTTTSGVPYNEEQSAVIPSFDGNNLFVRSLIDLARTFYSYLYKKNSITDFSKVDFTIQSGTHRALTVLGLICQYHKHSLSSEEWEAEVDVTNSPTPLEALVKPKNLVWSNIGVACYRLFSAYLKKVDTLTKCKAMEAFGGLFLAQPCLVLQLERIGLITDVMSEQAVLSLQLEALDCWKKILISEEQRIDGGEADAKMESDGNITVSKKISGDQDGDATLFGGVLTNHSNRLFQMTQSKYPQLRLSALELLGLLLRQGLVNPNEAVPYLYALQGDIENVHIRTLALRLLMSEGEKRPDILRQRVCAGVKEAYKLQRSIYSDKMNVSAVVVVKKSGRHTTEFDCIFNSVFKECIMNNRKQREGFYRNLLGLYCSDDVSVSVKSSSVGFRRPVEARMTWKQQSNLQHMETHHVKDVALLSFVAQVLAHLPYNTVNDPLFIVHHIGTIVTLDGPQCLERLDSFLRPHGLSNADDLDEINAKEDALERAALTKFPCQMHEANSVNSKEFNWPIFIDFCRECTSLCLLLRLKEFLCSSYNLSFTRCMEYDPNAKERLSDKGTCRVNISREFDSSFPSIFLHRVATSFATPSNMGSTSTSFIDSHKDSLIRQYAEFRRRLREEHSMDRQGQESCSSDNESDNEEIGHQHNECDA